MANWNDIKDNENNGFYDGAEFIDIKETVGKLMTVVAVTPFENDKGPGVAALVYFDGEEDGRKLVTHSIGVTKTLSSEEFLGAVEKYGEVSLTVKEGKSKKSGKYFYYVE